MDIDRVNFIGHILAILHGQVKKNIFGIILKFFIKYQLCILGDKWFDTVLFLQLNSLINDRLFSEVSLKRTII